MFVDDLDMKAQRKHLIQETVPMNGGTVTDSNQHLRRQEMVDQFHDFIKRLADRFHLSLSHQDALGNKGAAGSRAWVDTNHEHIGS